MNLQTFVEENESKSKCEFSNRGDSLKKKDCGEKGALQSSSPSRPSKQFP